MAAGEPFFRFPQVAGERREQQPFAFSCFCKEGFEGGPAFLERKRQQRLTGLFQQAVEEDQTGRRLARQALDAAGGGMKAHLQGVEGQRSVEWRGRALRRARSVLSESERRFATTSGKNRDSDLPDFALISTSSPALNARQRNPSHFGSNCQPGSVRQLRGSPGFHRLERQWNAEQIQGCSALLRLGAHSSQTNRLMTL